MPEELIAAGLALEMPAMALLDRDGVYGAPRFHLSAKRNDHQGPHRRRDKRSKTQTQRHLLDSRPRQKSHWLPESLPADHTDEVACAETRKAGRVCRHL